MSETMEQRKTETGEEQKKLSYSRETNWLKVLFQIQVTLSALCAIHFLLYESYWSTILFNLDPFNPTKGWFYSHIQSVALNLSPAQEEALKEIDMSDLEKDKMIMFQKRWYIPLYVIFVLLLPINAPAEYWGEQLHASMFLVFWLRYTLNLHLSWLIHSATRIWQLKPGEKYKVYRYVVLVSLMAVLCLGWAYIPTNWDHITITEITKVICFYGVSIGNLIQVFFIMKDGKGLRNVLDRLQSDLFQPTSFDQWEIAEIAKSSGRRIRRTFVVLNGAGFPTSLFCVFQLACHTFYGFIMVLVVTLNCKLLLEAGIQIDILKDRIAHSRGMDDAILECIQHSKEVISLVDQIKRIQEFPLLFYFGVQVFMLCTAIFSLTDQSTSLTQTIFHCDWIGSDVKSQKIIMFFMYISNTPLKISMAGGLCNLSISLFISIIRTAYSYFTLLTNFR
ncbi:unnamed protein product [Callosobruchus maculatus]|uniref:Odorant receptor n=1 Tax=Callosobruchus maculatus TaxID=64391 RepID=A0A653C2U6_CALMS|nr:unnamed protein product [Callosobruchus maculatus]